MIIKTVKYTDYDGNERNEDLYFNLNKAEVTEMELSVNGRFSTMLEKLVKEKNSAEMIKVLKEIILKSYGEKSIDGKRLVKSEEISKAFSETEAYVEVFMEIVSSPEAAIAFVQGILPSEIREKILEQQNQIKQEETVNAEN